MSGSSIFMTHVIFHVPIPFNAFERWGNKNSTCQISFFLFFFYYTTFFYDTLSQHSRWRVISSTPLLKYPPITLDYHNKTPIMVVRKMLHSPLTMRVWNTVWYPSSMTQSFYDAKFWVATRKGLPHHDTRHAIPCAQNDRLASYQTIEQKLHHVMYLSHHINVSRGFPSTHASYIVIIQDIHHHG